jgi:hypothetical protein
MRPRGVALAFAVLLAGDARAQEIPSRPAAVESTLVAAPRTARSVAWAAALSPITVGSAASTATASVRLYATDGAVDDIARARFEEIVAGEGDPHELAPRLEQLVFKAAYHFGNARVVVVSGWRDRAGRHTTGEALDFKLVGIRAAQLAAWLRGLPRVGVGIYTHPKTQYVHLDVRDASYHWIDGSPPGVTWREKQLRDPGQVKRDAGWTPEGDLP